MFLNIDKKNLKPILLAPALILSIIVFLSSIFYNVYDMKYYEKEYEKYNIYSRLGKEKTLDATQNLFDFFQGHQDIDHIFFNEDEVSHLYDVKLILDKLLGIFIGSFWLISLVIVSLYYSEKHKIVGNLAKVFLYAGIISIGFLVFVSTVYLVAGFDDMFIGFHRLLFEGNYMFDPNVSNMKAMFPDAFFQDMAHRIIMTFLYQAVMLFLLGLFIRKKLYLIFKPKNIKQRTVF
ncbi:MAG: DUF1461 domain-containing protein [Nanoarchaeota archaeon]|nr:DUF1461 domain-containing protein [Nanoarchaeota archaeon]